MKHYTIFILLAVCFHTGATAQQKISLNVERMSVTEVLSQIEKQSDYTFSYNPALLKDFPRVTVNVKDATLQTVLEKK